MPSDSLHQRLVALINTPGTRGSSDMPDVLPAIGEGAADSAHPPGTPPLVQQHA